MHSVRILPRLRYCCRVSPLQQQQQQQQLPLPQQLPQLPRIHALRCASSGSTSSGTSTGRCCWNSRGCAFAPQTPFGPSSRARPTTTTATRRKSSLPYSTLPSSPQSKSTQSTQSTQSRSTLQVLEELVRSGALRPDPAQRRVAKRLTRLEEALVGYDNSVLFDRPPEPLEGSEQKSKPKKSEPKGTRPKGEAPQAPPTGRGLRIPRGLYIYGKVGTGKTMLMDSFYENARVDISPTTTTTTTRKTRLHFHEFLNDIHQKIFERNQALLQKQQGRSLSFAVDTSLSNNPIHGVALEFAKRHSLLCLDEFQVTDVADALILKQLFEVLFTMGTVVVATSNRPPAELYEGGLNRSYFLPFLDVLEKHCIAHHIPSVQDYRRILSANRSFFLHRGSNSNSNSSSDGDIENRDGESNEVLDSLVSELARELLVSTNNINGDIDSEEQPASTATPPTPTIAPRSMELQVGFQRSISVHRVYGRDTATDTDNDTTSTAMTMTMACFTFEELCDANRGATDYRAIARAFDIVVLEDVPTMDLEEHNRARRFITLIDELYEGKCALVVQARTARAPEGLFQTTDTATAMTTATATATATTTTVVGSSGSSPEGVQDEPASNTEHKTEPEPASEIVLGIDVAQEGGTPVGALASVRELSFAFERSSSRIFEMCSRSWWDRVLGM